MKTQLLALAILVLPGVAAADAVNDSFTRMLTHEATATAAATADERLMENALNAAVRGETADESFVRLFAHQATATVASAADERVMENQVNATVRGETDTATESYARLLRSTSEKPRHEPVHGEVDGFATRVRDALQAEQASIQKLWIGFRRP